MKKMWEIFYNGKIPVRIDISVECIHQNNTVIRLLCAGRYSDKLKIFITTIVKMSLHLA